MLYINYRLKNDEIPRYCGVIVGETPHTDERERRGAALITAVNHRDVINRYRISLRGLNSWMIKPRGTAGLL